MRRYITYILLVTLTMQSFYRSILAIDYEIHLPAYLAKCINKDRPQLHCNGHCVLMTKIKHKEKKEQEKNLVLYESNALYIHSSYILFTIAREATAKEHLAPPYSLAYSFDYKRKLFHPPIA